MSFAFAKKIGMTTFFDKDKSIPVTAIQVQPSYVLQVKTLEKDGYQAVQLGSVPHKSKKKKKPLLGHVQKHAGLQETFRLIAEFKIPNLPEDKKVFDINDFNEDDLLDITGTTIGKGFTGVVKRWGFAGQPRSHGHDHVRAVGSIGSRWPQRVPKGKRMAGRDGGRRLTLKKVKIVAIDRENGLIFVNGSLPGSNSSFLKLAKNSSASAK